LIIQSTYFNPGSHLWSINLVLLLGLYHDCLKKKIVLIDSLVFVTLTANFTCREGGES